MGSLVPLVGVVDKGPAKSGLCDKGNINLFVGDGCKEFLAFVVLCIGR